MRIKVASFVAFLKASFSSIMAAFLAIFFGDTGSQLTSFSPNALRSEGLSGAILDGSRLDPNFGGLSSFELDSSADDALALRLNVKSSPGLAPSSRVLNFRLAPARIGRI
jgi:hypothetical protein